VAAFAPDIQGSADVAPVGRAIFIPVCELPEGMQKATEFFALSRWGEVSVLVDNDRVHLQSAAIVEDLADTLGRFRGPDSATRRTVREWL
jgi:hypothetical protein